MWFSNAKQPVAQPGAEHKCFDKQISFCITNQSLKVIVFWDENGMAEKSIDQSETIFKLLKCSSVVLEMLLKFKVGLVQV